MMLLRPSASHRWSKCAMSERAETTGGALPDLEGDAAREGTCAAWVAEVVINGDAGTAEDMLGKVHENGVEIGEDMVRFVQPYIDMVMSRNQPEAEVYGEVVFGEHAKLAGTSDAHGWSEDNRVLFIDDLKYGYEVVEPFENTQLICYAFLALAKLRTEGVVGPELIQLSIYQPRAQHRDGIYRKWVVSPAELNGYFHSLVHAAEAVAVTDTAAPGPHCKHCRLAAKCEALTHSVYAIDDTVQSRAILDPSGQQLSDELIMLERLEALMKARKAAVETEIEIRLGQQKFVPGWGMLDKKGKAAWKHAPEIIGGMCGIDPWDKKPITPAEARRRGAPPKLVESLSYSPTIGKTLQRVDDRQIAKLFK